MVNEQLVKRVTLFSGLDDERLARVIKSARVVRLDEGERLFDLGQQAERFFLTVSGQVKLFRVSEDGNEKIIEIMGPGQLFAEAVAFMEHHRYPVSAAALQPSVVYGFDNRVLLGMLRQSNELCLALLGNLSQRLHQVLREVDKLSLQNASLRIVAYLLDALPEPDDSATAVVDLAAPKQIIASRLSVTPETFSRILHGMAKQGILTVQGKTIAIHDVARLREFGHGHG